MNPAKPTQNQKTERALNRQQRLQGMKIGIVVLFFAFFMLVSFDPGKDVEYAIIVEKSTQKLFLYAFDTSFKKILSFNCSTGEVSGSKSRSGDKKTPEGVYFITNKYEDRYLSETYGTQAFPLDYPNFIDRMEKKNGSAIWIHGTNSAVKPRSSNGCVALANKNIEKLANYISLNRTPVIIVKKLFFEPVSSLEETKNDIMTFLTKWNATLMNGSLQEYQDCYVKNASDFSWWQEWHDLNSALKASYPAVKAKYNRVLILQLNGVYVVLFDQNLIFSDHEVFAGTRKLFLKRNSENLKIIGDEYQLTPKKNGKHVEENLLVKSYQNLKDLLDRNREITAMVEEWLDAWGSGDIQKYGGYYSNMFRFRRMNRNSWLRYKKGLNDKYKNIRISKDNLKITKARGRQIVTFVQKYQSSDHNDIGIKKLILRNERGQWKIYRETWKRL